MQIYNFYDSEGFLVGAIVFFIYLIICFMLFIFAIMMKSKISSFHSSHNDKIDKKMLYIKKANYEYAMKNFSQKEYMLCKSLVDKKQEFHPLKDGKAEQKKDNKHPIFNEIIEPKRQERIQRFRKKLPTHNYFVCEPCFSEESSGTLNYDSTGKKEHFYDAEGKKQYKPRKKPHRNRTELDHYLDEKPEDAHKGVYMNRLDLSQYNKAYQKKKTIGNTSPVKKSKFDSGTPNDRSNDQPHRLYLGNIKIESPSKTSPDKEKPQNNTSKPNAPEEPKNPFASFYDKYQPENGLMDISKIKSKPIFDSYVPMNLQSNSNSPSKKADGKNPRNSNVGMTLNLPPRKSSNVPSDSHHPDENGVSGKHHDPNKSPSQRSNNQHHPSQRSNNQHNPSQRSNHQHNPSQRSNHQHNPSQRSNNQAEYFNKGHTGNDSQDEEHGKHDCEKLGHAKKDYNLGENPYGGKSKWGFD